MSGRDCFVANSKLPGCAVIIDKRTHFWYIVQRGTRQVVDYGRMDEGRRDAYISLSSNDCSAQGEYLRGSLTDSD